MCLGGIIRVVSWISWLLIHSCTQRAMYVFIYVRLLLVSCRKTCETSMQFIYIRQGAFDANSFLPSKLFCKAETHTLNVKSWKKPVGAFHHIRTLYSAEFGVAVSCDRRDSNVLPTTFSVAFSILGHLSCDRVVHTCLFHKSHIFVHVIYFSISFGVHSSA